MFFHSAASPAETYDAIRSLGPVDIRRALGDRRWHRVLEEHQQAVRRDLARACTPGECELLGDDIGGIAVPIAARVLSHAGTGEILCSRTVKDLVAGAGFAFADRGTRDLKGVPDRWQLYAVEPGGR